jgi:hypothetical protein
MPTLNWWAILVATVVNFFFQGAWFTVFGKAWLEALGKKKEDLNPKDPVPYITAALGSFVNATVLAWATAWPWAPSPRLASWAPLPSSTTPSPAGPPNSSSSISASI